MPLGCTLPGANDGERWRAVLQPNPAPRSLQHGNIIGRETSLIPAQNEVRDERKHCEQEKADPKEEVGSQFWRFNLFLVHLSSFFLCADRMRLDCGPGFPEGPMISIAADGFASRKIRREPVSACVSAGREGGVL